jgi:hypothetical protein
MKKFLEAEQLLNEAIGFYPKAELKKESNENLRSFDLRKLTAAQVDQALENGGYSDNRIQKARFKKMAGSSTNVQFIYDIEYETDDEEDAGVGQALIFVDVGGKIAAEWYQKTYY